MNDAIFPHPHTSPDASQEEACCQKCGAPTDPACLEWDDRLGHLCAYCILEEHSCGCADHKEKTPPNEETR